MCIVVPVNVRCLAARRCMIVVTVQNNFGRAVIVNNGHQIAVIIDSSRTLACSAVIVNEADYAVGSNIKAVITAIFTIAVSNNEKAELTAIAAINNIITTLTCFGSVLPVA